MKKLFLIFGFIFSIIPNLTALDFSQSVKDFQFKNTVIGFGTGSRQQGDINSANWLMATDITGISLMTCGGIGLLATDLVYKSLESSVGKVTTADYWICGSVMGLGAIIFITSRIFGYILPEKFILTEKLEIGFSESMEKTSIGIKIKL